MNDSRDPKQYGQPTEIWELYEHGKTHNNKLQESGVGFYDNIRRNERIYAGDQWYGVKADAMPKPVFNQFKRIIDFYISTLMSEKIGLNYSSDGVEEDEKLEMAADVCQAANARIMENNNFDAIERDALLDSALSGSACAYSYFDDTIHTGNKVKGDVMWELLDSVNIFFGNPNSRVVNKFGRPMQPYILIKKRETVDDLRREAQENNIKKEDYLRIVADDDYMEGAGERSVFELSTGDAKIDKCTSITKLWHEYDKDARKYTIYSKKATMFSDIYKTKDTQRTLYPVAWFVWNNRKDSYHGQAVGTGMVPNQILINTMFAAITVSLMRTAFPKIVYDKDRIAKWSAGIGESIGVSGANGDVSRIARIIDGAGIPAEAFQLIQKAIDYTKESLGATDAALGNVRPENTSAIVATIKQSSVHIMNVQQHLYTWIEDIGAINEDSMAAFYGKRAHKMEVINGQEVLTTFDYSQLRGLHLKRRVDVGPSTYWSELSSIQTLDHLLEAQFITFEEYLERLPNGVIIKQKALLENAKARRQQQEQQAKSQLTTNALPGAERLPNAPDINTLPMGGAEQPMAEGTGIPPELL